MAAHRSKALTKIISLPAALLMLVGAFNAHGQSLSGLHIGDDSSHLSSFGKPSASTSYKSFRVRKWSFPNGNEFSATTSSTGRIVHLESDWGGGTEETTCDLQYLKFGTTTLNDLRRRFGSNGFGFKERGSVVETSDAIVMINSYEIGPIVVTFFMKIDKEEWTRLKKSDSNPEVAEIAKLDAISISETGYAKDEWGERVYDPAYKKAHWK